MPPADALRRLLGHERLPQAVALALSLQLVGAAGAVAGPWAVSVPAPAIATAPGPAAAPAAAVPAVPGGPVRLSAPGLWDGAVEALPLGVDDRGALDVPPTAAALGWWEDGARPGAPGASVVVGHVDLDRRPGVFSRLADAEPGMLVVVTSGREQIRFRVTRVDRYAKSAFPTDVVYRPSAEPELRLVTCGGRFDPRTGHYEDNVVVEAVRESPA